MFFKNKKEVELTTTEMMGYKFKVFTPSTIPMSRFAQLRLNTHIRDWGMTENDLFQFDEVIKDLTVFPQEWKTKDELISKLTENVKNIAELANLRQAMVKEDYQFKPYLQAASLVIKLSDEPDKIGSDYYTSDYHLRKMKLCKDYPEIEGFFLTISTDFISKIGGSTTTHKQSVWFRSQREKNMEKTLLQKIGMSIYGNGLMKRI